MWSEAELAYMAGIVDGEGHIGVHRNGRHIASAFAVSNTDPRMMKWIQDRFGGTCCKAKRDWRGNKDLYHWRCYGDLAERVIRAIYPYLVIKREQADIYFAFRQTVSKSRPKRGQHLKEGTKAVREALYQQMQVLRGKAV
jgi:hypothetical protein